MKSLKRIRYYTMNSWNNSTAPAYNLKVYKVINNDLQDRVYELMDIEGFYGNINMLIDDFGYENEYQWQAGFNGRSSGYLVLYKGGINKGKVYTHPGKEIDEEEVPTDVLKSFGQLAVNIVKTVEDMAKNAKIEDVNVVSIKRVINY